MSWWCERGNNIPLLDCVFITVAMLGHFPGAFVSLGLALLALSMPKFMMPQFTDIHNATRDILLFYYRWYWICVILMPICAILCVVINGYFYKKAQRLFPSLIEASAILFTIMTICGAFPLLAIRGTIPLIPEVRADIAQIEQGNLNSATVRISNTRESHILGPTTNYDAPVYDILIYPENRDLSIRWLSVPNALDFNLGHDMKYNDISTEQYKITYLEGGAEWDPENGMDIFVKGNEIISVTPFDGFAGSGVWNRSDYSQ